MSTPDMPDNDEETSRVVYNDPVGQIFALISRAATRRTARELLMTGQTENLEKLVMAEGILRADGTFDTDRFPQIEWRRPEHIEGEQVEVAFLETPAEFMNYVMVQRKRWEWSYRGNFDGEWPDFGRHSQPLSHRELSAIVERTGIAEHLDEQLRQQEEYEEDEEYAEDEEFKEDEEYQESAADEADEADEATPSGSYWVLRDVDFGPYSGVEDDYDEEDDEDEPRECTVLEGHESYVYSLAFHPSGDILASAGADETVRLWSLHRGEEIGCYRQHTDMVRYLAFHPSENLVASGSDDGSVHVFDSQSCQLAYRLDLHTDGIHNLAFSPDGLFVASASSESIRLWDSRSARLIRTFGEPTGVSDRTVAFSPDGRLLASGSRSEPVRIYEVGTGDEILKLGEDDASTNSLVFSPDGKWLLSAGGKVLHLWNLADGTELKQFDGMGEYIFSVAVHPDSRTVAIAGTDEAVWLWDLWTEATTDLRGHTDCVHAVAFSPSGTHLASASEDHTVRVWTLGQASDGAVAKDTH